LNALIRQAARRHGVSPALVRAVVAVESGFDPRAVSAKGARGLMQLMPATAAELNVDNVYDPAQNLEGGTRYLRTLLDRFDGDRRLALAAYNAGAEAVRRHGGMPPYAETREYVHKVLQRLGEAGEGQPGARSLTPYRDSRGHLMVSNLPRPTARKAGP
jgi:soluble lytic murein transglycosylase-like protein